MPNPKKAVLDVETCRFFSGLNVAYKWMLHYRYLEEMRQAGGLAEILEED